MSPTSTRGTQQPPTGSTMWDAAQHPRARDGRWVEAAGSEPETRLEQPSLERAAPAAYQSAEIPDGAALTVDEDGDDQVCSCSNSSWSNWWASGLPDGTVSMDAVGRGDDDLTVICPQCGLVFRLGDTDYGTATAPIGRFDTADEHFRAALDHQHRMLFGTPRRTDNRIALTADLEDRP
ncbi:MAG: hypothetical protein V4755_07620 [Curtobacterium sp.]